MASKPTRRVSPDTISVDRQILLTLQSLTDYNPTSPTYSLAALQELAASLNQAQEAGVIARRAHELARERIVELSIAFHAAMLAAKAQVIAQYGEDSPAVHAVGRKQKSERSRPTRRAAPAGD